MISGPFNFNEIKPINSLLALFSTKHYGIEHAYRVFKLVERLSEFEKLRENQVQIVKFCALFVDIGREENRMNLNYGIKSYEILSHENFFGKILFKNGLTRFLFHSQFIKREEIDVNLSQFKIENREEAILLFKILKDALALDAFRFGNFCAADLELSNSKKLVLFASQFHRQHLNQDSILEEIQTWLNDI